MAIRKILHAALFVPILIVATQVPSAAGDKGASVCAKPPELIPGSNKEEQKKARQLRAQGMYAISISEGGDVVDVKIIRLSSPGAEEALRALAKSMKFKARPGCGISKITVNYTLAGN
jgi:hypothetical protein